MSACSEAIPEKARCVGITKHGNRCKNMSVADAIYCHYHSKKALIPLDTCPVCRDPVIERNDSKLHCHHPIHLRCLKPLWKLECPVCRKPITEGKKVTKQIVKDIIARSEGNKGGSDPDSENRNRLARTFCSMKEKIKIMVESNAGQCPIIWNPKASVSRELTTFSVPTGLLSNFSIFDIQAAGDESRNIAKINILSRNEDSIISDMIRFATINTHFTLVFHI